MEITDLNTNNKEIIYYADAKSIFSMEWIDKETLYIYNHEPEYPNSDRTIQLKVGEEIYHDVGLACKSILLKNKYKTCYKN